MSLMNILVERDRVLVGVDSAVDLGGGGIARTVKLLPLPHLGCVLAGRGTALLVPLVVFVSRIETLMGADDTFEGLADRLPRLLADTVSQLADRYGAPLLEQQFALAGWSASAAQMQACVFTAPAGSRKFERTPVDELWLGAWDDEAQGPPPDYADHEGMLDLMRAQVADARERFPKVVVGGQCVTANITREHGISIRCSDIEARRAP